MVSIITITYNRAEIIGETIISVLQQSFQDFEYIILDDGSDDETASLIANFNEPRIKYHSIDHCGQISKLRNIAIQKATRPFIAFIDSDDLWDDDKLELQLNSIQKNEADFSFSNVRITRFDRVIRQQLYQTATGEKAANFFTEFINNKLPIYSSQTIIFRKVCFDELGGLDENLQSGDHDFICRLLQAYRGVLLYKPLATVRRHSNNHSNHTGTRQFEEYIYSLRKLKDKGQITAKTCHRMISMNHYLAGLEFLVKEEFSTARAYFWKSLVTYPFRIKAVIRILLSLFRVKMVKESPH